MTTSDPAPVRGRPSWPLVAACYAILVGLVAPLVVGTRTLYLRDLLTYHYSAKVVQARAMGEGFLPLVDPQRAGGQALVGNLNNVALYPDNLLYLVASPLWALNAHMWLHLLLAPVGVYWLARRWDVGREAAWAAGFVYAASGFFLSHLNLYNLVAGAAIAPAFVAACMALACGGASFAAVCAAGLLWAAMILAGEPLVAAAALIVAVSACLVRRGATPRSWALLGAALAA
ncbi:MAG: hypothetical protein R3190_00995, partial [Thermoanaerobaculia bacterium]|nr:hypothetical protein [Thermoanaerobaculia bacterium]